ncbi:hypothetical protein DOTSEDRAFT_50586 [Dothistroma septosporum NZE10]|uniref:Uncharacterized protein n=1 Tax=Dothistroma septosporum (strain NZE10 / CBS 128990) TaxID=675120 RepID=N1PXJ1_DOTSN|nr:hypothetical protein DOTSEDRAFT_50586 [Dothistroma septosporum NZE10]
MSGQQQATDNARASTGPPDIANLVNSLSNLDIGTEYAPNIDTLADNLFGLAIGQKSNLYNILARVTPTSLVSIESAIKTYASMIGYYEDQLDLDEEDPQLDVVRDVMAAKKCWVILHEQRRALVTGEIKLDEIWAELMSFWCQYILPSFAPLASHYESNTHALIDQLIDSSPELPPLTTWNPLDPIEIREVYEWILRTTSRCSYGEIDILLTEELIHELDRSFLEDASSVSASRISSGGRCVYLRCQRLFRTLAEISHYTRSVRIGHVLASFFLQRCVEIASADSSDALRQWCFAVLRASMPAEDQLECLRQILHIRSDLPRRLIGRGRKAEEVSAVLGRIVGYPTSSSRPGVESSASRLRTAREAVDIDIDLSLHIGSRRTTPLARERLNSLDDGIRVMGMDAVEAERELARDGRRMLNLTHGRRYGDRYDRIDEIDRFGGMDSLEGPRRLDSAGAGARIGEAYNRLGGTRMGGSLLRHGLGMGRIRGGLEDDYIPAI